MKPDFREFTDEVIKQLNAKLGSGCRASAIDVAKNNGAGYKAAVISDGIHNASPCIPIESYYELCQKPEDASLIADDILKIYLRERIMDINLEGIMDKEKTLGQAMFRVVGLDKNAPFLNRHAHYDIPELNLSMLFYINIGAVDDCQASFVIPNSHMERMRITREELAKQAWKNTLRDSEPKISCMREFLTEGIGDIGAAAPLDMYIITNSKMHYGAGYILYPEVQEQAAQTLRSDFYVLPSSLHETIALPAEKFDKTQAQELKNMVMGINHELTREETLSDNVYYYSCEKHKLYLAV